MLLDTGEWVANPRGFDPLRGYLHEIDNILITGEIDDIDTLRELRKDLSKIREDFLRFKMVGLYEKEEGGDK